MATTLGLVGTSLLTIWEIEGKKKARWGSSLVRDIKHKNN